MSPCSISSQCHHCPFSITILTEGALSWTTSVQIILFPSVYITAYHFITISWLEFCFLKELCLRRPEQWWCSLFPKSPPNFLPFQDHLLSITTPTQRNLCLGRPKQWLTSVSFEFILTVLNFTLVNFQTHDHISV